MDNDVAYERLINKPEGTYLLRENDKGDLRFSVRSKVRVVRGQPKVGHLPISKAEDGTGWMMGQNQYDSLAELIEQQKKIESAFRLKHEYTE